MNERKFGESVLLEEMGSLHGTHFPSPKLNVCFNWKKGLIGFKKKGFLIQADQWFPGSELSVVSFSKGEDFGILNTLEGNMKVSPGDWIITGIEGERYVCCDRIFRVTYEPIYE